MRITASDVARIPGPSRPPLKFGGIPGKIRELTDPLDMVEYVHFFPAGHGRKPPGGVIVWGASVTIKEPKKKKVAVFVDGQNLYHHVKRAFGYPDPNYDIKKLVDAICEDQEGWVLSTIDFYTGVPDEEHDQEGRRAWNARLLNMNRQGIKTHPRELKYRSRKNSKGQMITVAEEKGTDIQIALSIVVGAMRKNFDVALLFSQDQDFVALAEVIREIIREDKRWIKIVSVYPKGIAATVSRGVDRTDWIPFEKDLYDRCIDPHDYGPKR